MPAIPDPFSAEFSSEWGGGFTPTPPPPPPPPPPVPPPPPPPPPPPNPYVTPPLPDSDIGTVSDFVRRLKAVLPAGWFSSDSTPVLDGILTGFAATWSGLWQFLRYVILQKRLSTATDINIDLIAQDFMGTGLPRKTGEQSDAYKARIKAAIFREMGTRAALSSAVEEVTGAVPTIFEPLNANDTGGWGTAYEAVNTGLAYGQIGGYGSYKLPFQAFVQTALPPTEGVGGVQGYIARGTTPPLAIGGYGTGALEYTLGTNETLAIIDADIYAAINLVRPAATIIWVSTGQTTQQTKTPPPPPPPPPTLNENFILSVSRLASGSVTPLPSPPPPPVVVPPLVPVPPPFADTASPPPPPPPPSSPFSADFSASFGE